MKKNWKILVSVLLSTMLLSLPVFSGGDDSNLPDDSVIEPRVAVCADCTMVQTHSSETGWVAIDYMNCACEGGHKPMQDVIQENTVTTTYTCSVCGLSDIETTVLTRQKHYR